MTVYTEGGDDLDHLTEHDRDQIIRCGLAFSADNYVSREFAQQVQLIKVSASED